MSVEFPEFSCVWRDEKTHQEICNKTPRFNKIHWPDLNTYSPAELKFKHWQREKREKELEPKQSEFLQYLDYDFLQSQGYKNVKDWWYKKGINYYKLMTRDTWNKFSIRLAVEEEDEYIMKMIESVDGFRF
jgi:hypothetical protein